MAESSPVAARLDGVRGLPARLRALGEGEGHVLRTLDLHCAGEPARVVFGVDKLLAGRLGACASMQDARRVCMRDLDHVRQRLLLEPRGYPCQNANFILPSRMPGAVRNTRARPRPGPFPFPSSDWHLLFLFFRHFSRPPPHLPLLRAPPSQMCCASANESVCLVRADWQAIGFVIAEQNKIYPMMSGHNCICVATALLESGVVAMPAGGGTVTFGIEAPAGLIEITAQCSADGKAETITLQNAASFVEALDLSIDVPEVGKVAVDIAYGGMWYAVVDPRPLGLTLTPENGKEICRLGELIKTACREQHPVRHPVHTDYEGVDILVFCEPKAPEATADLEDQDDAVHGKNAVVMSKGKLEWHIPATHTGMLDRSPCGTGTCAVMAVLHKRGQLRMQQRFVHYSIIDSKFVGKLEQETHVAGKRAVIATITGSAYVTQFCEIVVDPTDIFPNGFTVGDIW